MQDAFIGIDVSKDKIDVAFMRDGKFSLKEFSNSDSGYKGVLAIIKKDQLTVKNICLEATGKYPPVSGKMSREG